MLCLLVGVFFILGTRGQTPDQYRCNLPIADIPNGKVELLNYQLVEDKRIFSDINFPPKVFAYAGRVRCDPGFFQVGGSLLDCTDGVTMKLPECLPVPSCKKSLDDPNMLSCGVGYDYVEAQCTIPNEGIEGFGATSRPLECGRIRSGSLVVNGAPAKHGDVPWHVGIYSKMTQPYMQTCGGTLVRNNVVISAAHCFWSDIEKKLPAENYAVAAGKIYRPWNNANDTDYATKSDVREIRIPPRYRGGATNFQDDLAVLLLTTPLQIDNINVVLACLDFGNTLDEKQLQDTNIGMVAGWGLTGADGPASQILNVVKLPIVDIDQCINGAEPSFLSSITSDKICAGFTNGTTVCRGDSGGGLALPEYDIQGPKYYLRGIVSTAPKSDHLCNIYAVATFTHIAKHEFFIKAALNDAPVIMETETFFSGVIEDDSTTRSSNESVNEPTDKPPVNPLNTNTNPAINSNVTDGIGNRSNNTDSSDINTEGNLSLNFGENTPTDKPTRRPGDKPISQKPSINTDNSPAVNPEVKPDISGVISNKYNKTDTLDLNTAITNAPPTENIWNINKPISNQEIINNTKDEDSITPSPVQGTLVTEPTASVLKPIVSDLLPINLDRNPDKPITGNIDQKPVSPVSSVSGDSPPDASDPKPVVPSDSGLVNQNPGSVQGSVPNKPAFDYIPPHHHQNHPDYNDWQYWHNNHQNWHNHHHNCHEHGHDYHQNWDNHQNWHNHHQDWQNYRNDWQNGPNTQQNWQTYYQNAQYNHQHLPNYDQNEYNKYQQNWHNYLVKSWQSKPLGYDSDVNQQSMPAANKNGYSGYGK